MTLWQHKAILENQLPDNLKLAIAKKIENNLFLKVLRPVFLLFLCDLLWFVIFRKIH
jgi:hypothetical protein